MVKTSPIKPHRRGDDRLILDKKSLLPPSSSRQVIQPMGRNVIEGYRSVVRGDHRDNSNSSSSSNNNKEANFDSNMVIILAALLCALICALGLNSIVRCALRCSRRLAAFPDEATATDAQTGLNNRALRQIPVLIYQGTPLALGGSMSSTSSSSSSSRSTECAICLGEFKQGDKIRVLPKCSHGFHVRCIDTWLLSHSSCPICRRSLLSPSAAFQATTAAAATTITTAATELVGHHHHHLPQDHHFGNANSPTGQSDAFVFAMDDVS